MKRIAPILSFFLILALSQLVFTLLWGNSGRLFLLSVVIALSFALSLSVAYMERALKKDLEQMSEMDRQSLHAEYPEEADEIAEVVGAVQDRHWLSQGVREFALEMLEVAGVVIAFMTLPVIVSLVKDGNFSVSENITVWQLGLGFLSAAIYVWIRHWLKSIFEKRKNA